MELLEILPTPVNNQIKERLTSSTARRIPGGLVKKRWKDSAVSPVEED